VRIAYFLLSMHAAVHAAVKPERENDVSGHVKGNKIIGCAALIPEYTKTSFRSYSVLMDCKVRISIKIIASNIDVKVCEL